MPGNTPRPRRKRDPDSTRTSILEAAKTILARDGAEGLSVSSVAQLAKVNRGTAYQHFEAKEDLIRATLDMVSQQLVDAVFADDSEGESEDMVPDLKRMPQVINSMAAFNLRLANYAVDNPEI